MAVVQVGMNFLFTGLIGQFLGMISSLQMIFILPGLPVNFPANIRFFFKVLMPFVTFDFIPTSITTEVLFQFDEEN